MPVDTFYGITTYTLTPYGPIRPDTQTADLITWVPAASTGASERDLTSWLAPRPRIVVMPGKTGFEEAPVRLREITLPRTDGAVTQEALLDPRIMNVSVFIEAETPSQLRLFLRQLRREFNPLAGDGLLRIQTPDGEQRQITCRCIQGLEGNEAEQNAGPTWREVVLTFRAADPYLYGTAMIPTTYTPNGTIGGMFPFPPLVLGAGLNTPNQTLLVQGEAVAWPVWIIKGPATSVAITRVALDPQTNLPDTKTITINQILAASDVVTIDARPNVKSVTLQDGTNYWPHVSADSALFPLLPGQNALTLTLTAGTNVSYVLVQYTPRYSGL